MFADVEPGNLIGLLVFLIIVIAQIVSAAKPKRRVPPGFPPHQPVPGPNPQQAGRPPQVPPRQGYETAQKPRPAPVNYQRTSSSGGGYPVPPPKQRKRPQVVGVGKSKDRPRQQTEVLPSSLASTDIQLTPFPLQSEGQTVSRQNAFQFHPDPVVNAIIGAEVLAGPRSRPFLLARRRHTGRV